MVLAQPTIINGRIFLNNDETMSLLKDLESLSKFILFRGVRVPFGATAFP